MKKATDLNKYNGLSPRNIVSAVSMLDTFLTEHGIDYELRAHHRLLLEMLLTEYAEIDRSAPFWIITHRSYKKVLIQVRVRCESFNITEKRESPLLKTHLKSITDLLEWKYKHGENRISYECKTVVPGKEALGYVIHYMDKEKKAFRTGVVLRFVNMLLLIIDPLLAARIVTAFSGSELKKILLFAVLIALLDAASSLVTYIASRNLTKAYTTMRDELQTDLSQNMLEITTEHVDSHGSGVFVQRIVEETGNLVIGIDEMLAVITEAFRLIGLLIAFATVSIPMLVFEIVLFVVYFLIVRKQAKVLKHDNRLLRISKEKLNGFVTEMVKACRDIKLLHCEDSFTAKAKGVISDYTECTQDLENHSNTYILARTQFNAWTNLLYIATLVLMMSNCGMTAATALVLYNYNGKTYASARGISSSTEDFYSLLLSAERVYQLLKGKDFSKEKFGEEKLETIQGDIAMRDVHFGYKHENDVMVPVLKGMNMHIEAGESVAFVGKSGCGKSTILSLITRLYEPARGEILLDGADLSVLNRDSIRGNIGMVSQSPYLFNMSIRDNFTVVKKDVTDEEMIEACKTACIHDDIMKFASGYDTIAGEGGVMLSGGQRQRIALARCLIRDYPIIVLDEATSALDNDTQQKIQTAIENMRGKTLIMVAHRLSTVINCDRLFFIEDGNVLAAGSHSELLENCEAYRQLYGEELAAG